MKVALVCPYDLGRFGGVQDQVLNLGVWLREAGHEAVLVGPGESGPAGAVLVGRTRTIRANGSNVPVALAPAVVDEVAAAIAGVDVVHVHEPLMPLVSLAAMTRATAPIVATFHAAPSRLARGVYRAGRRNVAKLLRRASVVTAVSPVAAHVLGDVTAVRRIPNGLDVSLYPNAERRSDRVVFVGRDEPRKGLPVLLAAWPAVRADHPDAELVVIGSDAPPQVPPGVHYLGRVEDAHKRAVVAASGVACAPNLGGESFGIVVAEALAAGCAVVASALPGFVHVAGDAALLVKPGDAESLAWALRRLLADAGLAAALRNKAVERARRFDKPAVLDGYLRAYHDALAG